ncbi:HutD/Ves family protein [Noviherbaspirillum galbum]|uniref:HutD family protein n=1 Tax=Noviherbaspirillum galbum TaxID=2709383 RepID=A0A6B3SR84_9BURK|nr:HutD family protein [Noviherbaspirillum galbum]NEX60922.1 HutD family protein [Noviherbaspirillum galbum]
MRKLSASDFSVMPWKNGGGTTTQLAVHPHGAGIDGFGWRVSMASVASDGPFSAFPGVDRSLAIVDGAGLRIAGPAMPEQVLLPSSPVFRFQGEAEIHASLAGGPVTDFNVMTRRAQWRHALERIRLQGDLTLGGADGALAFCLHGSITCGTMTVQAGEALQVDVVDTLRFSTRTTATFFLARFFEGQAHV